MDIEDNEVVQKERKTYSAEIEEMLERERSYRQNNEFNASTTILPQIVEFAFKNSSLEDLCELILQLIKKRGQPVKAQVEMVRKAMTFIEQIPEKAHKMEYVKCLRDACEKKIYLEVEYARCVLMIVKNEETSMNIDEAAKILQDVQVETYGSMDHREKVEFILYQMKIMIKKNDMIRLLIVSRKVTEKTFKGQGIEDLRIQYFGYLSVYQRHEQSYFESATSMKAIVDSMLTGASELSNLPAQNEFGFRFDLDLIFQNMIFYTVISEHSQAKIDLLTEISSKYLSLLEKKPLLERLVTGVRSRELIDTNIENWGVPTAEIFQPDFEHSSEHKTIFRKELIRHNVMVCSQYYERSRVSRLAELSGVPAADLEEEACYLINSDIIKGKIDRVEGIIVFRRQRGDDDVLDDWVQDVNSLLDLVNHTCNLIDREEDTAN